MAFLSASGKLSRPITLTLSEVLGFSIRIAHDPLSLRWPELHVARSAIMFFRSNWFFDN
jgi:hypothetical protein